MRYIPYIAIIRIVYTQSIRCKIFYSCGGFNTPTLCVVTKGIKADCDHLMRTTTPTQASGLLFS